MILKLTSYNIINIIGKYTVLFRVSYIKSYTDVKVK